MALTKFKKGDIVQISPESQYYSQNSRPNPRHMPGTITFIDGVNNIEVEWENGHVNGYTAKDLELYKSTKLKDLEEVYNKLSLFPDISKMVSENTLFSMEELSEANTLEDMNLTPEDALDIISSYTVIIKRLLEERKLYQELFNQKDLFEKLNISIEEANNILQGVNTIPKLTKKSISDYFTKGSYKKPYSPSFQKASTIAVEVVEDDDIEYDDKEYEEGDLDFI